MKIINPYKNHLLCFFETINDFKHISNRLNKVLSEDLKKYSDENATYYSSTALIIGDWTGIIDNGWKLPFHTGIDKITKREGYAREIKNVLSLQFGLSFAQCYEALETLIKNMLYVKIISDEKFRNLLSNKKDYSRNSLKGGNELFDLIKKAGGDKFKEYSKQNNNNFKFKEIFVIFSEVWHAVTHSKGELATSKIPKNKYYQELFEHLLPLNNLDSESTILKFEHKSLNHILVYLAEFGFQIFKTLSEEDAYEWKI